MTFIPPDCDCNPAELLLNVTNIRYQYESEVRLLFIFSCLGEFKEKQSLTMSV